MKSVNPKEEHDLSTAVINLFNFVDLVESGYDFSTKKGLSLIEMARKAISQLADKIVLDEK